MYEILLRLPEVPAFKISRTFVFLDSIEELRSQWINLWIVALFFINGISKLSELPAFKTSHSFTHCVEELRKKWINLWTVSLCFHKWSIIDSVEFRGGGQPPLWKILDFMLIKVKSTSPSGAQEIPPGEKLSEFNTFHQNYLNYLQIYHSFVKPSCHEEL